MDEIFERASDDLRRLYMIFLEDTIVYCILKFSILLRIHKDLYVYLKLKYILKLLYLILDFYTG